MSWRSVFVGSLVSLCCLGVGGTTPQASSLGTGGGDGTTSSAQQTAKNPYDCQISASFPFDLESQDQVGADGFAWKTFLSLNVATSSPQWTTWRPTVDLIDCNQDQAPAGGECKYGDYVPDACKSIENYGDYQILDQVGKVDDAALEAEVKGLSSSPVITSRGTFLRYLILLSPQTTSWILGQELQKESELQDMQAASTPVAFLCSDPKVPGSNGQSTVVKLAWMEAEAGDEAEYYTQDLLVFTPSWRSSTGKASCVKQTMALVGMHVARKTVTQPSWVWATFEHRNNAPDCASLPPTGNTNGGGGPSTSCPATVSKDWNFYGASCQTDGKRGACQSCNTPPVENGGDFSCVNPISQATYDKAEKLYESAYKSWVSGGRQGTEPEAPTAPSNWCLDQPPAKSAGTSRLCRQVGPGDYYPGATSWDDTPPNKACQPTGSVWANYQLISTQWSSANLGQSGACPNVQDAIWKDAPNKTYPVIDHAILEPRLAGFKGKDGQPRTFLANTSMESYERSNCIGCHAKTTIEESIDGAPAHLTSSKYAPKSPGTDFIYFLGLQVPAFEPKVEPKGPKATVTTSPRR